jgi:hypothetical protein
LTAPLYLARSRSHKWSSRLFLCKSRASSSDKSSGEAEGLSYQAEMLGVRKSLLK